MGKSLSDQHNALTFEEKTKLSETREKIVAKVLGWNRIGHQWIIGLSDFVLPEPDHPKAEMKTDFRMDETGQYWLDLKSWTTQGPANKLWVVSQSGRAMDTVDILWVCEVAQIAADLTSFEFINMHSGGYMIPVAWLDEHAIKKHIFP